LVVEHNPRMKKLVILFAALTGFATHSKAQQGYDIKINLKGCTDTAMYLVRYVFDQQTIADTCKNVKNGLIVFKNKKPLEKGMYAVVSTGFVKYFDFIANESQKFTITGTQSALAATLRSADSKENDLLFSYARYMTGREAEYRKAPEQARGKSKSDSAAFVLARQKAITGEVKKFEEIFREKNKGTFVCDFLNLRTEKYAKEVPKASNGRPDSVYQYFYYKNHYLEGINFKDERIVRVPYFDARIKKYMSEVIVQHPDTIIKELDKILASCDEGSLLYNQLIGHFTYKYEQNKTMSFDRNGKATTFEKVFVHLGEKYIASGKANAVYSKETVASIKERVSILSNLLPESKVSELFMIDTTYGLQVRKMGFDTASSSKSLTDLYYKNVDKLTPLFKTLYQVRAKYTVLVFWAADCDHCLKEVPKLHEALKELKGKTDVKVFAVQTKDELFDDWKKIIVEKKLTDFIHVFDPVHLNNTKERFDITATPVIYLLDHEKRIKGKKLTPEQTVDVIRNLENMEKL
jgi:thiol-disulfide isomerase/thioredoxin